jgi:tRNA(Ile)-lysidine synthase
MNRSGSKQDLIERVAAVIEKSGLMVQAQPVIAGVSGGVDSMVLLWILADALKLQTIAVHINYGKRGVESDADEELVRRFCHERDLACEVHRISSGRTWSDEPPTGGSMTAQLPGKESGGEIDEQAADQTGNFQEQARNMRRRLLTAAMQKHGACGIFLAHHRDDQTETVFQKILRGAAPEKWRGMLLSDPPWFRPLLEVPKQDLLDFAGANGIPFRTDASNLESGYTRNILRNEVFPILDTSFPEWRRNIDRVTHAGQRHQELLDHVTGQVTARPQLSSDGPEPSAEPQSFSGSGSFGGSGSSISREPTAALDRAAWLALPPILRTAVARHWLAGQTGYAGWSEGEVQRLAELSKLPTGKRITLGSGLSILRDRGRFEIETGDSGHASHILHCPDLRRREVVLAGITFSLDRFRPERRGFSLQLDLEALPENLLLRCWHAGDRIRPFGMKGSQLISDHLTNKKVSAAQKKSTMVLVSFDGKVHAVIFPHRLDSGEMGTISEYARCHTNGQPVLLINKPDHHS